LFPDYICNVVPKSIESASFQAVPYKLFDGFQPNLDDIRASLSDPDVVGIVISSVYGSDPQLDFWLGEDGSRIRSEANIFLILDLCQMDISGVPLPAILGNNIAIITSYNNKNSLGLLGAMLWTDFDVSRPDSTHSWTSFNLLKFEVLRIASKVKHFTFSKESSLRIFEYSKCTTFPFEIVGPEAGTRIQLSFALAGRIFNRRVRKNKTKSIESLGDSVLQLPFVHSSPYFIYKGDSFEMFPHNLKKSPYAIHGNEFSSLLPELKILKNSRFTS
jgi:hypothetical protein